MDKQGYLYEVDALHAPASLRGKIGALPGMRAGLEPAPTKGTGGTRATTGRPYEGRETAGDRKGRPYGRWGAIAATLVLVVGLGVAMPAIFHTLGTGGDITLPPVVTVTPTPEGIIAEGIDVSPVILDAAKEYVGEQCRSWAKTVDNSGLSLGTSFDNWRIEAVEAVYDRKELGDLTVAVYRLSYRIHATTPEQISLANWMEIDSEGWVSFSVTGSTYLVFMLNYSTNRYFGTYINNDYAPGSGAFDKRLKAEIDAYVSGLGESPTPAPTPQAMQGTAIDELDYAKLEGQMDTGDWSDLQEYLPVLREGASFLWVPEDGVTGGGGEEVTLEEYYRQRFGSDFPDGKLDLERFTLFGFEGTGKQDLILCFFNSGGNYLILHREGEEFYGFERGYRSFQALQRDGVYTGSGGASYNSYYRIKFQAGFYEEELLGEQVGGGYEIGGIAVSAEYFWTWRQNCMAGDMYWYYPAQPTGKKPPPSTEYERRYHVSIQALPLEEPFLQLPEGLRATLEDTGEVGKLEPGSPWIMKTYRSPALEVQTLMVSPEMLEQLLAEGTYTQEQYDAALGTEYIYTARPLDSSYPTGSGLRLGDSVERARELFYTVHDSGKTVLNAVLATLTVTTENGMVTGLLSSSGGRTVGGIVY